MAAINIHTGELREFKPLPENDTRQDYIDFKHNLAVHTNMELPSLASIQNWCDQLKKDEVLMIGKEENVKAVAKHHLEKMREEERKRTQRKLR